MSTLADLLAQAQQQYPFVTQYNPVVTDASRTPNPQNFYAETWHQNDGGDASTPRPANIPIDRTGVQVFRPNEFSLADLAAEFLHVDPFANGTRDMMARSMSPGQVRTLRHGAADYSETLKGGGTEQQAMNNAVDSAMRGYTADQWPASANAQMNYTPEQMQSLNSLRQYMQQGYYPSNFDLGRR